MSEKKRFDGCVAIVTGGASGIGAASARRLADEGAHVVVVDVDEAGGSAVAEDCGGRFVAADVSDPAAWADLVGDVERDLGSIDLAHLNAGIMTAREPYPFLDTSPERYRTVMGVNLDGVVLGVHAIAPAMLRSGGGSIVATASRAGLIPYGNDPIYAATKHGVVGFVRSVAPQLRRAGVRVHAICPGGVDTPLVETRVKERIASEGRPMLDPVEVAAAVAELLASEEAGIVRTIEHGMGVHTIAMPTTT